MDKSLRRRRETIATRKVAGSVARQDGLSAWASVEKVVAEIGIFEDGVQIGLVENTNEGRNAPSIYRNVSKERHFNHAIDIT